MADCPICIEHMHNISTLDCGHRFHTECIDKWKFTGRQTCPLCRGEPKDDDSNALQDEIARALRSRDAEISRLMRKARDLELENIRSLIKLESMQTKLRNQEKESVKDVIIAAIGMMLIGMSLIFKLQ